MGTPRLRVPVTLVLLLLLSATVPDLGGSAGDRVRAADHVDARADIIVVMVDDLGYLDDDRVLRRLPNVRGLWLEGGLRFRRMFDETPMCCPARATFLTGQHTLHHRVVRNDGDLLHARTSLPVALHRTGYHTIQVGKYLNDYSGARMPRGWDHASIVRGLTSARFWRDGRVVRYGPNHVDVAIRRQAVGWVRAAPAGRPLFAWVTPSAPHACSGGARTGCFRPTVQATDRGAAACQGIARFKPPTYRVWPRLREYPRAMPHWPAGWDLRPVCESLLEVDRLVGQLREAQAERDRPAWFVLMSDNGMSYGQKGFPTKSVPTATRLPFYVAGPGVQAGVTDLMLSNIDIPPTLADLGRTVLPGADGRSFRPFLQGRSFRGRTAVLELQTLGRGRIYWASIRTPTWRLIRWSTGRRQLYRWVTDRWERRDMRASHRPLAKELERRLDRLIRASRGGT